MSEKHVYFFGEGKANMKNKLGGKGANLAEMTRIGLPVPHGFTITTDTCRLYYENKHIFPKGLSSQIIENMQKLELESGASFGDKNDPLLLSVRSGAPISMPGMMDSILNLGLNQENIGGLINKTQDERFAYDCYRRFLQMFGNVVLKIDKDLFEEKLTFFRNKKGVTLDNELETSDLKLIVEEFKT